MPLNQIPTQFFPSYDQYTIMKKSIPFLALLFFFIFACNKNTEPQITEDQAVVQQQNGTTTTATDRDICCTSLIVSSTYFNGISICGVTGEGAACTMSSSCGNTCGGQLVLPNGTKNASFCFNTACPVCFTNLGNRAIQIMLNFGLSTVTIDIPASSTVCGQLDCNGNIQLCPPG